MGLALSRIVVEKGGRAPVMRVIEALVIWKSRTTGELERVGDELVVRCGRGSRSGRALRIRCLCFRGRVSRGSCARARGRDGRCARVLVVDDGSSPLTLVVL